MNQEVIEMAEIGLEVLWPFEDTQNPIKIDVDIVFVHGLRGGRRKTWKRKDWATFWLRDLLPLDVKHARIMTVGKFIPLLLVSWNSPTEPYCKSIVGLRC